MPGQRSKYLVNNIKVMTSEEAEQNAREIVDYSRICFAHPAVEGILMWGFWEGANWIPVSSLYKRDWTPYPAAEAYHNLIYKEWWTHESGVVNNNGIYSTPAFYGKYKVTVNGVSKEISLTKEKGGIIVDFLE
jgi:endo-1,4-beta-xylanase